MFILARIILIAFIALCAYGVTLLFAVMGSGLLFLMVLVGLVWAAKRNRMNLTACGTARWAGEQELRRAGLTAGRGLVVGTLYDAELPSVLAGVLGLACPWVSSAAACSRFLQSVFPRATGNPLLIRLSRSVHTAVIAPSGSGKNVSCVFPFLLDCPESCVVVDFKGENAETTMERRRKMGHRIVLLDPYNMVTNKPDTLNPLDFISKDSPLAIDEIRDLAESFVIRNGQEKDVHFLDSAEAWIAAMTAAVVEYGDPDDRSMQTVRDLLSDPEKMDIVIKLLCESEAWQGMLSRMGHQLTHFVDKEKNSTVTTVNRFLRHFDTLAIAANTTTSSFDPADLLKGKMTIYLVIPPEHARAVAAPMLRMWISTLFRAVLRGGLQERNLVHFVLDEAASLSHMSQIDDAISQYRGFGIRLKFFYQSLGQLKTCFPEGQDITFLSNVTQVFFGVNDQQSADYVSARLGEATIVVKSGGRSWGGSQQRSEGQTHGSYSTSWNNNDNWQQQARKLLKPEEVMALSPRTAITFAPGVPPICTRLIRYYEQRPDTFLKQQWRGLKACVCSLALLAASVIFVKNVEMSYQYHLEHPRVRAIPNRRFR